MAAKTKAAKAENVVAEQAPAEVAEVPAETVAGGAVGPVPTVEGAVVQDVEKVQLRERLAQQQEQINQLMAAVLGQRQAQIPVETSTVKVASAGLSSVGFTVRDDRGQNKDVFLESAGDYAFLTEDELQQLQVGSPRLFSEGYLSLPDRDSDNPNVIADVAKFVEHIDLDTLDARLERITAIGALYRVANYIESRRFVEADQYGRPLTEKIDGADVPVLHQVALPQREQLVLSAVQGRIAALGGARISADGGE